MGRIIPTPGVKKTAPAVLLHAVLILALSGCGGGDTSNGEGGKTSAETGGGETAPARTSGGETTSAIGSGGGTVPGDVLSATIGLSPSPDSDVSGTAVLTDIPGGLEVTLNVRNLPGQPGTEYPAHVHEGGTCADEIEGNSAVVLYTLDNVIAGRDGSGLSNTAIPDATVAWLFSGAPKYVDVHAETTGDETPPGVSCAQIYTITGGD